jgi:tRNA threonylcarbamoyladenosine biosynthesis protein TsaB
MCVVKLLGIETSSTVGSLAVAVDGELVTRSIATPREQTDRLLELIAEVLAESGVKLDELDGIAFGRGPGSFTGLRIAAAAAQGFALATGVPLLPVSSLAALAQGAWRTRGVERALACVDARMGEVYVGEFAIVGGLAEPRRAEVVCTPEAVAPPAGVGWTALGDGFTAYAEALASVLAAAERALPDLLPHAQDLLPAAAADLAAGRAPRVEAALPVYLRDEGAWHR